MISWFILKASPGTYKKNKKSHIHDWKIHKEKSNSKHSTTMTKMNICLATGLWRNFVRKPTDNCIYRSLVIYGQQRNPRECTCNAQNERILDTLFTYKGVQIPFLQLELEIYLKHYRSVARRKTAQEAEWAVHVQNQPLQKKSTKLI